MKMKCFDDTDTLYTEFTVSDVVETKDFGENTVLDLDPDGSIISMTMEHAIERTDINHFSVTGIAA